MFPPPIVCRRTHRWNAMCCPFPLMRAEARSGRRDFPDLSSPNLVLALGREKSPSRRLHLFLQQLPSLFTSHRRLVNPQQPSGPKPDQGLSHELLCSRSCLSSPTPPCQAHATSSLDSWRRADLAPLPPLSGQEAIAVLTSERVQVCAHAPQGASSVWKESSVTQADRELKMCTGTLFATDLC